MPYIASATMTSILKKHPRFPAASRLGKPSTLKTSFCSCTLIVTRCTYLHLMAIVAIPHLRRRQARTDCIFASDFSSRRLLEITDSPIVLARHLVLPRCETWVHESHTIALLGEAAHPNLVSGFQAQMAGRIWVLTALFHRPDGMRSPHISELCLTLLHALRRNAIPLCPPFGRENSRVLINRLGCVLRMLPCSAASFPD